MSMSKTTETSATRIDTLDIIRGFTIGGILFANILWLSGFLELSSTGKEALSATFADQAFLFLVRLLIHGKFYYIFAFMFGMGFAILMDRAIAKGQDFTAFFSLRLIILLGIGVLHALFWWGDIVRYYALFGFTLLGFRFLDNRKICWAIILLLLLPPLMKLSAFLFYPDFRPFKFVAMSRDEMTIFFQQASFTEWFRINLLQIGDHLIKNSWSGRWFKILGMFLTGMLAGRTDIFRRVEEKKERIKKVMILCLAVGLIGNLARVSLYYTNFGLARELVSLLRELIYTFAVPALAIAYVTGFMLFCHASQRARLVQPLAAVGRTSLSNYVGQTLLCVIIFRSYFLGFYGHLSLSTCANLAFLIYLFEIWASNLWIKYYRYGPLEWVWRSLNYRQWQPLRKSSD